MCYYIEVSKQDYLMNHPNAIALLLKIDISAIIEIGYWHSVYWVKTTSGCTLVSRTKVAYVIKCFNLSTKYEYTIPLLKFLFPEVTGDELAVCELLHKKANRNIYLWVIYKILKNKMHQSGLRLNDLKQLIVLGKLNLTIPKDFANLMQFYPRNETHDPYTAILATGS